MRQGLIFSFLMALFCGMFMWAGYVNGKRDADRWYAQHPVTNYAPLNCPSEGCEPVTLTSPIKVRVPAPQAQIETPKEPK